MGKVLLFMLALIVFTGCSTIPAKNTTLLAKYNKLLVRNINWNETAISELAGDGMNEYIASQPRLNELFRVEFGNNISQTGLFDKVSYGDGQADADTLVLEPKIYTLKAGGYMPGASYTGLLKTADGKLVGKYAEERRTRSGSNPQDTIERLIKELAEDAASKLPFAR